MTSLWQDVRFALRSFSRTPSATLLSIATLALGIGANAAIFTVVHRVLIAPLPYPAADRVVLAWRHNAQMGGLSVSPSLNDLRKWQSLSSVEALTMYSGGYKTIIGGEEPKTVFVHEIDPQLLDFTGTQPQLGRPFTRDDAASEAAARVVLLTDRTWRRDFGADPLVIGAASNSRTKPTRSSACFRRRSGCHAPTARWLSRWLHLRRRNRGRCSASSCPR